MARLTHDQVIEVDKLVDSFLDKEKVTTLSRRTLAQELSKRLKYPVPKSSIDDAVKRKGGRYLNAYQRRDKESRPTAVLARAIRRLFEKMREPIPDDLKELLDDPSGKRRKVEGSPSSNGSNGTMFNH